MADPNVDVVMKAFAHDAVAAAARRGVVLDYSEQSLDVVDELLGRESFIGQTPRTPDSNEDEETLWVASKMFGAYVGEVVLRTLGGKWVSETAPDGGIRPTIMIEGARGFPVDKVWKRLTESEYDALGGYCRALRYVLSQGSNEAPQE
jgi:hypothetical protein